MIMGGRVLIMPTSWIVTDIRATQDRQRIVVRFWTKLLPNLIHE